MRRRSNRLNELKKGAKFVLGIAILYTIFWLAISSINLWALKAFTAGVSSALLSLFGVPNILSFGAEPAIVVGAISAQITNLCAGDLEIALLLAIVLATFDRSLRQRAWGCLFGIITVLVLNPIRIFSVLAVGYYAGWNAANTTHDLLFRLMLLAVVFGFYYIWYVKYDWFAKKATLFKRRIFR